MDKKNIVIIGLGGVGGYFGFKINEYNITNQLNHISFVARNETYNKVKDNGLVLISSEHQNNMTIPDSIIQNISEIQNPDLVLICVKEYDLENICDQLKNVISKNTILLPMMNGADIYDRIKSKIPNNTVLPSCVYVASHIKEKGVVEHKGNAGKLIFGKDPEFQNKDIEWVENLIKNSKINYDFNENPFVDIWTKFIFIASFGLVTAKYNSSIGTVCQSRQQKEEALNIMNEIKLIADKKGIGLPENIHNMTFEKASTFPPETPTSLQLDVHSGKGNSELELFAGAIIKYGADLEISCKHTIKIYKELKSYTQHTI